MVFAKEGFSLQFFLLSFWTCCLSNSNLDVLGDITLLGLLPTYVDDVVLLAPCASVLRFMLSVCESFANECGLCFNPSKSQLIRGWLFDTDAVCESFFFCAVLRLASTVDHLGNRFKYDLSDDDDVLLKSRHLSRAANASFHGVGPFSCPTCSRHTAWLIMVVL